MGRQLKVWSISIGFILSLVYLITSGIQTNSVPYVDLRQLQNMEKKEKVAVKVTGKVVNNSLDYNSQIPRIDFKIHKPNDDSDNHIRVRYDGVKPDAMREGGFVTVTGNYHPSKERVEAHRLMAKCPSKYENDHKKSESQENESAAGQPRKTMSPH